MRTTIDTCGWGWRSAQMRAPLTDVCLEQVLRPLKAVVAAAKDASVSTAKPSFALIRMAA
jgi:hypothetical protein